MKTIMFLSLIFLAFSSYCQTDSLQQNPIGTEQKEDRVEIRKDELPPAMKTALDADAKFKGWQDSPVYFERNTDQYLIHITSENTTQTYRFDKKVVPIVTDAPASRRESRQ